MSLEGKNKVLKDFVVFCFGIFLNYAGYLVLLGLQSSINIEDGVGLASVTATFATSSVFGVLVTPIILRKLGPKIGLLFCEVTYLAYIGANAYPAAYTLIPAGILTGMGEATMWPVMGLFVVHYARCYSRYGEKSTDAYITQFFGVFYGLYQFSGVCGNLISYAILFGGSSPSNSSSDHNNDSSMATPVGKDLSICGINDCQNPNITEENSDRYEVSATLIYILVGVTGGFVILAMFTHGCLTKAVNPSLEVQDELSKANEAQEKIEESAIKFVTSTVKETILHMINPQTLLLTPFALYSGLFMSFGFSEISRAFGSCMLGVEKVGLLLALVGAADAVMSFSSLRITSHIGRDIPVMFGYCLDITNYMICIFWIPTESSLWVVYIIFLMVGLIDGIWQPLINEIHASSFPKNRDIALTVWNMYTLLGITWQTAWSTSFCVSFKVYFQIGFLTFSVICYGINRKIYGSPQISEKIEDEKRDYFTKL